jgi:hypothetical protein
METVRAVERCEHPQRSNFSRASHFALCLIPFLAAVVWFSVSDYLSRASAVPVTYTPPYLGMALADASLGQHVLVIVLFIAGAGSALWCLRGVDQLDEWESKQPK